MAPKKKKAPRKSQKGAGVVKDVMKFIKNNKLISKGLGMIPHPIAQVASKGASLVGLGKKKKKKRAPRALPYTLAPLAPPGALASPTATRHTPVRVSRAVARGYPRNQVGTGIFSDLGGGIGSIFGGLGGGIGSVAKGLFGGGARGRPPVVGILPRPQLGFAM